MNHVYSKVPIYRDTNAARINEIINHPSVRATVADVEDGVLDVSNIVNNELNYVLIGEHGGIIIHCLIPGVYEVHTQILPEGRGPWTLDFLAAVQHYMFTKTDCFEGVTRIPHGHVAAKAAALAVGMTPEFQRPACRFKGRIVPVDVYSIDIMKWASTSPFLEEIGREFHDAMQSQWEKNGGTEQVHDDDPNHNRYVGAALEMARGNQVLKAVSFYNRWARVSRHSGVQIVQAEPTVVEFDIGYLTVQNGQLHMAMKNAKERAA